MQNFCKITGIHGVAGILGAIMTGIFADPSINSAGAGLLYGNIKQLLVQLVAVAITIVYDAIATFILFLVIKATVGLKVSEEEETAGLDKSQHGESAYNIS